MRPGTDLTAPATRRTTLAAALVAAAALRPGSPADAKSSCKKKARRSVDKTCRRMRDECQAYYDVRCGESSNPPACREELAICCGHLEACNFTEHVQCIDRFR
jgi:hypothetical protein